MPGSSPTMERREPIRRLKIVDLPTLGLPTMARSGIRILAEDSGKDAPSFVPREENGAGSILTGSAASGGNVAFPVFWSMRKTEGFYRSLKNARTTVEAGGFSLVWLNFS